MSGSVKRLAFAAVFTAISVITNIFTFFFGGTGISLSVTYFPIFLSGVFFGPWIGLVVGLTGDVLGQIIAPQGAWIPFITISSGLIGFIPGVLFSIREGKLLKNPKVEAYLKICISMILVLVICTAGLNTFGLWLFFSAGKKTFWVYLWGRLSLQATAVFINLVLICAAYPILNKILGKFYQRTTDSKQRIASHRFRSEANRTPSGGNVLAKSRMQDGSQPQTHRF